VLALLRREEGERVSTHGIAVFADPVFRADDPRVRGSKYIEAATASTHTVANDTFHAVIPRMSRAASQGLPRLIWTRLEADAVLRAMQGQQALSAFDFDANRDRLLGSDLNSYRIVHLATHGFLDSRSPELSGLVFSQVDEHGKPTLGFVGLEDVYNMHLAADLVVLSACQTALGREVDSEGIIGLTRGFMHAGAARVIASLWNVNDAATARFMAILYAPLQKYEVSPAAALRRAQLEMLHDQRWSAPYYWAAFTLQGDWKPQRFGNLAN